MDRNLSSSRREWHLDVDPSRVDHIADCDADVLAVLASVGLRRADRLRH